VASTSKEEVYFGHDRPWDKHPTSEPAEEFGCEEMSLALVAIQSGDDWAGVADNQLARRESTSSTRSDRSSSSLMIPA